MDEKKKTQLKIANILLEMGMDIDVVETMTSLSRNEIIKKRIN